MYAFVESTLIPTGASFAQNLKQAALKMEAATGRSRDRTLPGDVSCELTSYNGKLSPVLSPSRSPTILPAHCDCQACDEFPDVQFHGFGSSVKVISPEPSYQTERTSETSKRETITSENLKQDNLISLTEENTCLRYKMICPNIHNIKSFLVKLQSTRLGCSYHH